MITKYILQEITILLKRFSSANISICEQEACCRAITLMGKLIRHLVITEDQSEKLLKGFPEQHIMGLIELKELTPNFYHDSRCLIIRNDLQETISILKSRFL